MPATRYDDYESDSSDYEDSPEWKFGTYATIETTVDSVFGTATEYGNSLGIEFHDIELIDGCLYADPEKHKFKLFSWQESNDMAPVERLERGEDPDADDAADFIRKTYVGNEKEYELVAARVDEVVDDDGEVIVEADSKQRSVEFGDEPGDVEFGDWEDLGGDTVEWDHGAVAWYSGGENGPSVSSRTLAETLTRYGENAVVDEDDVHNWLTDVSGTDMLRPDLNDRRIRFFIVTRTGEDYTYNLPIIEDVETGEQIRPNNSGGGDTGNSSSSDSDAVAEAAALDEGDYPEPLADFLSTAPNLNMNEDRANALLDDLVESSDNALTEDMLDDYGGRDTLIADVV